MAARRGPRGHARRAADSVGGVVRVAARAAGRERLAALAEWLEAECRAARRSSSIPGARSTPADLAEADGGVVVLCTGVAAGPPRRTTWTTARRRRVLDAPRCSTRRPPIRDGRRSAVSGPDRRPDRRRRRRAAARARPRRHARHARPHRRQRAVAHRRPRAGQRAAPAGRRVVIERRSLLREVRSRRGRARGPLHGSRHATLPGRAVVDAGHRLPDDDALARPPAPSPPRRRRGRAPHRSTRRSSKGAVPALAISSADRRWQGDAGHEPLPLPVHAAAARSGDGAQPHRVLRAPHQLRRGRPADRAARRVLRGARRGRRRADHHRGALDPPDRLALREADPRLPPRRSSPATGASPTPCTATARRSSPRSTTTAARRRRCTRRLPVWAPSPVADPLFREVPKAVDQAEIAEIVAGYALVAEHCAEGGFDGIELQCSHSSIVRGFLSPATNRRTDDYGGSLENRARLLLEIVGRRPPGHRPRARPRRAALRRRADRGRHHHRRGRRGRPAGRGDRATSTTSTPRSAWPRRRCS